MSLVSTKPTGREFKNILPNVNFVEEDKHIIPDRWDYQCCFEGHRKYVPSICPCGSDRKYRNCCWPAEDLMIESMPELWRLRVVEQYIIDELFNYFTCFMRAKEHDLKMFSPYFYSFFKEKYGVTLFSSSNKKNFISTLMEPERNIFNTAWAEFMLSSDDKPNIAKAIKTVDNFKLFRSWVMYNWIPNFSDEKYSGLNGRPLVTTYMKDRESVNPSCISSKEGHDFITMATRTPYSFWSVEAVTKNSLTLKDLIYGGQAITVPEVRVNFDVVPGDILYCKVDEHDDVYMLICDSGAVFKGNIAEAIINANIKELPANKQDQAKLKLFHNGTRKRPYMLRPSRMVRDFLRGVFVWSFYIPLSIIMMIIVVPSTIVYECLWKKPRKRKKTNVKYL
jgi:hypothetical protein